ncbi:hypothetical protein C8R45DRAFT_1037271 [Mycena sanguinolenta]|nr:hypothetical protein C8R45DRAFT_1037271 [Mycena sanguinolenta]
MLPRSRALVPHSESSPSPAYAPGRPRPRVRPANPLLDAPSTVRRDTEDQRGRTTKETTGQGKMYVDRKRRVRRASGKGTSSREGRRAGVGDDGADMAMTGASTPAQRKLRRGGKLAERGKRRGRLSVGHVVSAVHCNRRDVSWFSRAKGEGKSTHSTASSRSSLLHSSFFILRLRPPSTMARHDPTHCSSANPRRAASLARPIDSAASSHRGHIHPIAATSITI